MSVLLPRTEYREQLKTGRSEKLSEELILCFSETSAHSLVEPLSYIELPGGLHVPAEHQQSSQTLPGPVELVRAEGVLVHKAMQSPAWSGEEMTEKQGYNHTPKKSSRRGGQRQWAQKVSSKTTGPQTLLWPTSREVQMDLHGILISC